MGCLNVWDEWINCGKVFGVKWMCWVVVGLSKVCDVGFLRE